MGKDKQAVELFRSLLNRYEQLSGEENADERNIPLGPRILAEKVLARIAPEADNPEGDGQEQEARKSTGGE